MRTEGLRRDAVSHGDAGALAVVDVAEDLAQLRFLVAREVGVQQLGVVAPEGPGTLSMTAFAVIANSAEEPGVTFPARPR